MNNDAIDENDENFFVNLSNPLFNGGVDAARIIINDSQGQATILDNDSPPGVVLGVTEFTMTEAGGVVSFTAGLTACFELCK